MQFTLIGNPENRRCQYFIAALKTQGLKSPFVVSYLDILTKKVDLDIVLSKSNYLRIDSPGENFEVTRQFLALANQHPNVDNQEVATISEKKALELPFEKGRIQFLGQTHLGFLMLLNQIQKFLDKHPKVKTINSIKSIQLMFDKIACHQHFEKHNIKVVPAIYTVKNYDDLRHKMKEKNWTRVFIKPIHGSSASGVIAYRINGDKEQAITSAELVHSNQKIKIFNALKIHQYSSNKNIKYLIDTLAKEGVLVEKWIPKASLDLGVFDLRMVVIGGKAQHTVVRQSQSPMTNLHLGNQRGDLTLLKETIGIQKWQSLCTLAEQAAQSIPDATYLGLDVIISNNLKNNYILEANAFGDLLPNIFANNMDTYQATVAHLKRLENV
jgi:glutathione synthase/RimK-type ligase-like ATP-grasp enzyme